MEPSLLAYGLVVHLVLLYSIFDIFYSSPLVRNARSHPITNHRGPADRLVIFSADGLRSSSFYGHPEKSPFLHDLIRNGKAAWGISQSHVPTESRPGHVAFMAGFYEDVSAVARGWKHNPVQFDSIVNQSRAAWLWGSADIVMLFSDNGGGRIVHRDFYSPDLEIFGDENAEDLDKWVFDKVEQYFSENGSAVMNNYGKEKALFFLHLLGLDTNGHGNKPRSDNYLNNIEVVDAGVKRISELFRKAFNDDKTAFLFTADHGMTDWGSHGAGTDDEILVPFVAWGAGVTATHGRRLVVNQVDLTPFQAALLGTAVPVNNVGVLPLAMLNASAAYKFNAAYGNLKQMIEQYAIKRAERVRNSLPFLFRDYQGFTADALDKVRAEIRRLADARRFDAAATACVEWIPPVRDALLYFHRYQRFSLGLAVVSLFVGWIALVYRLGLSRNPIHGHFLFVSNRQFTIILVVAALLIAYQRLPVTNYLYFLLPIFTFSIAWNLSHSPTETAMSRLKKSDAIRYSTMSEEHYHRYFTNCSADWIDLVGFMKSYLSTALLAASLAGISLTILVSVFFERFVCSITFAFLAPLSFFNVRASKTKAGKWRHIWTVSCLMLGVFPLADTVGRTERPWLVVAAPFMCVLLLCVYNRNGFVEADDCYITLRSRIRSVRSSTIQLLSIFCALTGVLMTLNYLFQASAFLILLVRIFSWLSLPIAAALPLLCAPDNLPDFLVVWMAALFPLYALLSIAYESLFMVVFGVFLFAFVRLEFGHLSDSEFYSLNLTTATNAVSMNGETYQTADAEALTERRFSPDEWRRALLLVCMVEMAFFGTGNIASLNSFNTNFLRNFVTVFSPFLMAALLALKMAIPFFQLAMAYALVLRRESGANVRRKWKESESRYNESLIRLSALIMIITDAMAIIFFYHLKDDGSWLEIGISISNYVISMVSSIGVFLLLHLTYHLTCLPLQWTL